MAVKIAIDAMGSDQFPFPEVRFLKIYNENYSKAGMVLVGDEKLIRNTLKKEGVTNNHIEVVNAPDRIAMDEPPVSVRSRKNSSIAVSMQLLKRGDVDAVVSAGNTGAVMAGALFTLGRIHNISRPALVGFMPGVKGFSIMLDLGANVDCKPEHLFDFAIMGHSLYTVLTGENRPRVGILSIGEEDTKGNELVKKTKDLLKSSDKLNFIGNVEGREVFYNKADVIVCDGFDGNVFLKGCEGITELILDTLKREVKDSIKAKIGMLFLKGTFESFKKKFDYSEYGGAMLAGVNGNVVITHGRATPKAIKNAVDIAYKLCENNFIDLLKDKIRSIKGNV